MTTGVEIADAFADGLDAFVSGIGTGGTITGAGKVLAEKFPGIDIVGVEPAESAVLSGGQPGPHKIQGIGTGFVPKVLDRDVITEVIAVAGDDAIKTAREVADQEGFLVGISSGAAVNAALQVAKKLGKGKKVLAILPDNGERYLSTALYDFED